MRQALVIGGLGNIGYSVTKALLQCGYDVTILGRNRPAVIPFADVQMICADRQDREGFRTVLQGGGYEYVVDLACFTAKDAEQDCEIFPQLRHLIVISSGAVYGALAGREIPIREDMQCRPQWRYGIHKKEMEEVLLRKSREEDLPVTIFRPTVTYGRQKTIVRQIASDNSWIDRIRRGRPIVTGNLRILRNFLYVDDAAGAFTGAFAHEECKGQVYNLCGLKPYDWGDYHSAMMQVLGKNVAMVEIPLKIMESSRTFQVSEMISRNFIYNGYYSGEKIARDIPEFCPVTTLEEGLARAVDYLDRNGWIPDCRQYRWEDELIEAQRRAEKWLEREGVGR